MFGGYVLYVYDRSKYQNNKLSEAEYSSVGNAVGTRSLSSVFHEKRSVDLLPD